MQGLLKLSHCLSFSLSQFSHLQPISRPFGSQNFHSAQFQYTSPHFSLSLSQGFDLFSHYYYCCCCCKHHGHAEATPIHNRIGPPWPFASDSRSAHRAHARHSQLRLLPPIPPLIPGNPLSIIEFGYFAISAFLFFYSDSL